jgi:predicted secreted protein
MQSSSQFGVEMSLRIPLALAAVICSAAALAQPLEPRFNQIELQAEVSREVQNDLMTALLYAEVNDAAAAEVANRLNRLTADALKIAGEFKSVKARSGSTGTYPLYDRANRLTGWRGRSEVRLESKDVQAMANLIGKLQASMQLAQVAFTVSPELRRQTENDLIAEAVSAFRGRADIAAKALSGKQYKIRRLAINTSGSFPPPRPFAQRATAASAAEAAAPTFESGTSTVQVSVSGNVELE